MFENYEKIWSLFRALLGRIFENKLDAFLEIIWITFSFIIF